MNVMRTKGVVLLLAGIAAHAITGGTVYASCGSAPISHGSLGAPGFFNCGPDPSAFAWEHKRSVQRIIGNLSTSGDTVAGHDSGNKQNLADSMMLPGSVPGSYFGQTDFSNPGWDGCIANASQAEQAVGCAGSTDYAPLDYAIAGVDAATSGPNVARLAVLSVDFNEFFQSWQLDQAGAAVADGNPCNGDAFASITRNVDCLPIPVPQITGVVPGSCSTAGCTLTVNVADVSNLVNLSMLDDCNVAEDKATNCPRNLYQGRVLVFKHGTCSPSTAATFDRRAWLYPASPPSGTLTVSGNFSIYSVEDANLNGALDAGEDGTNGGVANGRLDPYIAGATVPNPTGGTGPLTAIQVRVPAVSGASDCIFLGLGIMIDAGGGFVNPPTNTIVGEATVSPLVSIDPNPVRAGTGTPVSDVVTTITAIKSQGKGTVGWSTGIELTTSGFNVIGTKKGGQEIKLNPSLIAAKEGTTGKGAEYTVTFDGGQLKGSTSVFVEIVKTDGSKERFGPASF